LTASHILAFVSPTYVTLRQLSQLTDALAFSFAELHLVLPWWYWSFVNMSFGKQLQLHLKGVPGGVCVELEVYSAVIDIKKGNVVTARWRGRL